ncbi:carbohydrate ABC transporter permease [Herbiconiux sp. L3-i23]|uniref:carbohydrate ABC transporter permease n=1 Tax=Herbiconiux sp. L3-i23 TaxID=2905871 RepID=UPI00205FF1BF|nr:sugar ABC transporter permease [Herbiconiux sp. L3-i23]BDI22979.1 sugar ABC transporter permease [Herbiconiux sp. L3-i23]
MTSTTEAPPRIRQKRQRVDPVYYLFLLPALALFTVAITVPAITGIVYSFTDSIGFGDSEFIGFLNYAVLFTDPAVLSSYGFTLGFSLATVILVNLIAFFLALGLTSQIRLKNALRSAFVIPMVVSGIIIAYVFQYLFSNSLPALGETIGNPVLSQSILANADLAWIGVVIVTAWQAVPSAMLIYIAGLLSIPGDVYEAAQIDGAGGWQRLRSITIPLVAGYIVINVIVSFKNFINSYDIIVGLTNGGPGTATRSVAMTIFTGFTGGDYAYQMANAAIFFLIAIFLAVLQLRVTRGRAAIG